MMVPAFAIPAGPEVLVLLLVLVLLFGSSRIPQAARAVGESFGEFRKGAERSKKELDELRSDVENDVEEGD